MIALPKGFKPITGLSASWKPRKKGETVQGILRNVRKVNLKKRGKIPARTVNVFTITTERGDVDVWESAALRALADVKKGSRVAVVYLGPRKIPGRPTPMRDFAVGVK